LNGIATGEGLLNKTESVRNWLIILVVLIATGVLTAVLPLLNLNLTPNLAIGGGATRPPVGEHTLVIHVPTFLAGTFGSQIVLTSFQVFAVFAGLLVVALGSIVVVGLILSFLIRLLSKSVTAVSTSESYQANVATLDKREQDKLKNIRESHAKPNAPADYVYHLDPLSLSLIILFFVALVGTLLYSELAPTGEFVLFGQTISSRLSVIIALFIITIPVLAWQVRRQRLLSIAQRDDAPIPWDFIAVLVAGLLIVGIGLGLLLFINSPA